MSHTLEATFEDGVFKPLGITPIPFQRGQKVKLTIEMLADDAPPILPPSIIPTIKSTTSFAAGSLWAEHQKLHPYAFDPKMATFRDGLVKQMEPPIERAVESIGVPAIVWRAIVKNFSGIQERVLDIEPATPANSVQKLTRKALTIVGNISSLLIYLVLVMLIVRLLMLSLFPNRTVMDTLAHLAAGNIAAFSLLVLGGLAFVRVLFVISDFVKSYRVLTIIGVVTAIKALVKTSFLLLAASSIAGMWGTLWEFFSGALK